MTLSDLRGHLTTTRFGKYDFCTALQQLTRFQLILCVARSLCDSWASCHSSCNQIRLNMYVTDCIVVIICICMSITRGFYCLSITEHRKVVVGAKALMHQHVGSST